MPSVFFELFKSFQEDGGFFLFYPRSRKLRQNCRDTKNHLTYGNGGIFMNTLVIVVIAAGCLAAGYLLYGRWLAHKWGI